MAEEAPPARAFVASSEDEVTPAPHPVLGALSLDHFIGGRVQALQPLGGYRAATDPVLLAAAVSARAGESVLELGCGAGVASLCLGWRVAGVRLSGVELQSAYADLALRNAALNRLGFEVHVADISALPAAIRARDFDHVMANPPWYRADAPAARDEGRATALREATPLDAWVATGLRRLRPGGSLTIIQLAERLPALLAALEGRASVRVLPIQARAGRPAKRVLVQAVKGARAPFTLLAPLCMHAAPRHLRDGEDSTPEASAVLRLGHGLKLAAGG